MPTASSNVRARGQSGKHMLALSFSAFAHFGSRQLPKDISCDRPRRLPDVELGQLHWAHSDLGGRAMQRREFIAALGAAAAWPLAASAQQRPMASIGYLGLGTVEEARRIFAAMRPGLAELGYVEGQDLEVQFRCADYHVDRLPALAADLVRSHVATIIAPTGPSVSAARAATQSIPIIFFTGFDPVESGFVASLNRPGGNVTGFFLLDPSLVIKRLEVLHELVPAVKSVAALFSPTNVPSYETSILQLKAAATVLGIQLRIQMVIEPREFEETFEALVRDHVGAVLIGGNAVFENNRDQIVALAARHTIPAIYPIREFPDAGALCSYGTNYPDARRQVGVYAGRVLKGEKPADLPVQQVTKIELVINLKTAKSLGITVPQTLLARADELIE
jgi:putative tryptophan/tyrosine transport system substrate-binding protein